MQQELASVTVYDGLGADELREVSVDVLKSRFFILGLQTGIALEMCAISALIVVAQSAQSAVNELSSRYYPLFRGLFFLAYFSCLYGVLLFLWKRSGIAYATIFGVRQSEHNYHAVIRAGFTLVSVNFTAFMIFFLTLAIRLTPYKDVWPLCALIASITYLGWPYDHMPEWRDAAQRGALARTVIRVLTAPFSKPSFAHCLVADVCCSMPKCFIDLLYTSCIYATGEWASSDADATRQCAMTNHSYYAWFILLSLLPFWVRLMQCMRAIVDSRSGRGRNCANALKYITQMSVVVLSLTSGRSSTWLVLSVVSTIFAGLWDVLVDWGLGPRAVRRLIHGNAAHGDEASDTSWLLRPVLCFPPAWYYVVAVLNTVARLGWAVYISGDSSLASRQHVTLLLGLVELYRRAQWALLRVEWEQIRRSAEEVSIEKHQQPSLEDLRERLIHNKELMQSRYVVSPID